MNRPPGLRWAATLAITAGDEALGDVLEHFPRGHHVEQQRGAVVVCEGERAGDVGGEQVPRDGAPTRRAARTAV